MHSLLHYQHSPEGTLVTLDEPSLAHCCHPESTGSTGLTLGVVQSVDKCVMTCIYHYRIIQSRFPALKVLCAPYQAELRVSARVSCSRAAGSFRLQTSLDSVLLTFR